MFKAPFDFDGRIRRKEYGISLIVFLICVNIIDSIVNSNVAASFLQLLFIPLCWFILAQGAKRCHDKGKPGWYYIYPFFFFSMLFSDSNKGQNEYGLNPKEHVQTKEDSSSSSPCSEGHVEP